MQHFISCRCNLFPQNLNWFVYAKKYPSRVESIAEIPDDHEMKKYVKLLGDKGGSELYNLTSALYLNIYKPEESLKEHYNIESDLDPKLKGEIERFKELFKKAQKLEGKPN